jgi:hypothetical protein
MIVFLYYKHFIFDKNMAEEGGGVQHPKPPPGYAIDWPNLFYYAVFCNIIYLESAHEKVQQLHKMQLRIKSDSFYVYYEKINLKKK